MNASLMAMAVLAGAVATAGAGELKKDYFGATKPGAWATYRLEASDGTKSESSSQRNADEDGHVVVEEGVKITAGAGAGTEVKNTYVLPKGFNVARDWLSYGKFTEKMTMKFGTMVMPVDATTLDAIKKGTKDYRGAMTFEAAEKIDGHDCDRYAYSVAVPPAPGKETGQIWLDATLPFGIVKQVAKSGNADGTSSSFEIKLVETGAKQIDTPVEAQVPVEKTPAAPAVVSLLDGYKAGRIGITVTVEKGSNGKRLEFAFINKTDLEITVKIAAGALEIPASDPIGALKVVVKKAAEIIVPAGDSSGGTIVVDQQPGRGPTEGKFELSVYEGTQLFSGSVTKGTVSK